MRIANDFSLMRTLVRLGLVALAVLLAGCGSKVALAPDADPQNLPALGGDYLVNGRDPYDQGKYGGRMVIEPGPEPGTYRLTWLIREAFLQGEGRLEGNQLVVTWRTAPGSARPMRGTARYTITQAGQLYGQRWIEGLEQPVYEEIIPDTR